MPHRLARGGGSLGVIRSQGFSPLEWEWCPLKEAPESFFALLPFEDSEKLYLRTMNTDPGKRDIMEVLN